MNSRLTEKSLSAGLMLLFVLTGCKGEQSNGEDNAALQNPDVAFYEVIRDQASLISQNGPACRYFANIMVSMASPTNGWPLGVRKQQVYKIVDRMPDYCAPDQ